MVINNIFGPKPTSPPDDVEIGDINVVSYLLEDSERTAVDLNISYGSSGEKLLPDDEDETDDDTPPAAIRFQVVLWHVGEVDAVLGKVDMRFRITLFWNVPEAGDKKVGYGMHNPFHKKIWAMIGRQRAYERELNEIGEGNRLVYVPPLSILNAIDFEVLGDPEVCLLDEEKKLMKWSCLYKASMLQENLQVNNFPHDNHELVMRFGILKHRSPGKRWDRSHWTLGLATKEDTQESIKVPRGLIVEHVKVPGFSYKKDKMTFDFVRFDLGGKHDSCLEVKVGVSRDSSYYDRNIIPLLSALNLATLSILVMDADQLGNRGEIILAAAFVEIGIRLTIDSRLPIVGYQIKIQMVLNNFFYGLLYLVCESAVVYTMFKAGFPHETIKIVDCVCAVLGSIHLFTVMGLYYCYNR